MNTTTTRKHTYEDYAKLPEGESYELINGELIHEPLPVPAHQRISRRIEFDLVRFVEERKLGEVFDAPIDVYLREEETYRPDIIFITSERLDIIGEKKIEGAPDLVIEILSLPTAYYDLCHKKRIYEESGVKEYWIVDPIEQSIEVYQNTDDGFTLTEHAREHEDVASRLLPGFVVAVEQIFQ